MHRFRKKSDAKRAQVPDSLLASHPRPPSPNHRDISTEISLSLPPASDFRTSLILPSLSRRFTLLRDSNGDPVSLDDLKTKFAEQRAKGAENHITEEEEDMIVEELSKIRASNAASSSSTRSPNTSSYVSPVTENLFSSQQDNYASSVRSGVAASITSGLSTTTAYPPSSPSSAASRPQYRYAKRNSNNLFGSSRFHDTSYIHSASKTSVNSRSTASLTGSDSQGGSVRSIRSLQATENNGSKPITPNTETQADATTSLDKGPNLAPSSPSLAPAKPVVKEFSPQQMGRTSLALEQVIRGIEEEAEETIMIPRRSVSRAGTVNSRTQSPKPTESSAAGTPIPWMTDEPRVDDRDPEEVAPAAATPANQLPISSPLVQPPPPSKSPSPAPISYRPGMTSPTPRLPGYIPGMPRPLTPRDVDSDRDDGLTGYSTTPRARSPAIPSSHSNHIPSHSFSSRHHTQSSISSDTQSQSILPPSILRSSRGSGPVPPLRTASPALGMRSRGNSVSGIQVPSPLPSPAPDDRFKSDFMMRRPLSPFGGSTGGYSISRPGTPSAGLWQSTSPLSQSYGSPSRTESPRPEGNYHMRNGSYASSDIHGESSQRTNAFGNYATSPLWIPQHRNGHQDTSLDSSVSSIELGHPLHSPFSSASAKIAARVPTPVSSNRARSPVNEPMAVQDPILLNRVPSKRGPRRMQTPPPHSPASSAFTPPVQTPSSNSSSNLNLNMYMTPSPLFSPLLNASTTSLSSSSSYHSWTEKTKKTGWDELLNYDATKTDWKALLDHRNGDANGLDESDMEDIESPEQILRTKLGITKKDLLDLQTRLVEDAINKRTQEQGARSPIRRRRMSGSRVSISNASRPTSPAPPPRQPTPIADASPNPIMIQPDARSRGLLDSLLNSIQSPPSSNTNSAVSTVETSDAPTVEPQSTTDDDSSVKPPSAASSQSEIRSDDSSAARYKAIVEAIEVQEQPKPAEESRLDSQEISPVSPVAEAVQSREEDSGEATEVPPARQWRSPAAAIPASANIQLHSEVGRKAAEATAALKSRPQIRLGEPDATVRRKPVKRIDVQQISNPQLVSSSTSVNAIPISAAAAAVSPKSPSTTHLERSSSTKFADRFKKLKGTLRTKPPSRDGSEVTPFIIPNSASTVTPSPLAVYSTTSQTSVTPSTAQTLHYIPQYQDIPASAVEPARPKAAVPAPPASAGPGLKGFISRWRKPRKDSVSSPADSGSPQSSTSISRNDRGPLRAPSVSRPSFSKPRRSEDVYSANTHPRSPTPARSPTPDSYRAKSPTRDPAAVDQFFNAARQMGLDEGELKKLLDRSTSRSSRNTTWTQASAPVLTNTEAPPMPTSRGDNGVDRSRTPDSVLKSHLRPNPTSRYQEGEVVRRTIIFASDNMSTPDLNGLGRKESISGRQSRSASAASIHSMGNEQQPAVPKLPAALARGHVSKPSQSSSFFDMYAADQDDTITPQMVGEGSSSLPLGTSTSPEELGHGPAVEVVQLSNGEVVWSVLDSLRADEGDDDSQSLFRRSFSSSRGHDGEEVEVRVKEHRRWDSRGSNFSQGSIPSNTRTRGPANSSAARPETKLYRTNASTIGRLIEDLSRNMDSGSFNFQRHVPAASTSSSFHSEASGPSRQVERDLEALLNAISPRQGS